MEIPNVKLFRNDISVECGEVFTYPVHTHSHYELTLYTPFDGGVNVNGEYYVLDKPSVFLISPSDFHRIEVNGESGRFIKIGVMEKVLTAFNCPLPSHPFWLESDDDLPLITELFSEIAKTYSDTEYISALVATAVRCTVRYGHPLQSAVSGKRHELVLNALRYIGDNYCSDISLGDIAAQLSVSPQYLSTVFPKEVGMGISVYIAELRLRRAEKLLRQREKNVTEICFECGFRNLSYFLRSFKAKYGLSPKEYRQMPISGNSHKGTTG